MTTQRQSSLEENEESPPLQCRWQAHAKSVVSLQVVENLRQGKFILSASADCTAKLWTVAGDLVGMFARVSHPPSRQPKTKVLHEETM